tara:strand:- start:1256 stop:2368 length:1113 start_codon:yes stop_codon:yes gene_type:complete
VEAHEQVAVYKAMDRWLPGYLRSVRARPGGNLEGGHVMFCVADHYEPFRGDVARDEAVAIVRQWCAAYQAVFAAWRDDEGRCPRHTFFYPEEEYDAECLDLLAGFCREGFGEVEVHLHHRHDTADGLRHKLTTFRDRLHNEHGLLGSDRAGATRYGFVHGNWALCNSRPDGDWCGVNEELSILRSTGCYADFTFPSVPSPTQPRTVNSIYYARDRPGAPRGHDAGRAVTVGGPGGMDDELMLVQGPLALNWSRPKWGILPRIENGEITGVNPPTTGRIKRWLEQRIHVRERPEWVFIKLHTHGCLEDSMSVLLGDRMLNLHRLLQEAVSAWGARLHYVTAREMYNVIRAAESGNAGNPNDFLNYAITMND